MVSMSCPERLHANNKMIENGSVDFISGIVVLLEMMMKAATTDHFQGKDFSHSGTRADTIWLRGEALAFVKTRMA